jgi:chitin disaccharide deacetylase
LRLLIVNADDFGCSRGVNRGIIEAHERGIVTSASLMVNRPAAAEAAEYAREHPELAVGLHVEVRRWRVRRRPWSRIWSERSLQRIVARDVALQHERFRALMGRDPTHIDSHQHRHRAEPLRPIFLALARDLRVPLRHYDPGIRFCGAFYGHDGFGRPKPDAITPAALMDLLAYVPSGVTELCSHPGYPEGLKLWYREERVQEIRTLCDPAVRKAIARLGITLVSFRQLAAREREELARV